MTDNELREIIRSAVLRSIDHMGVENFEKCSWFISNQHKVIEDASE